MRTGTRLGAALLGATAALLLSVSPSSAAAVEGTVTGTAEEGMPVKLVGMDVLSANLIELTLPDKAKLKTYCIEIDTNIPDDGPKMVEAPWDAYPNPTSPFRKNNAKINWILHHSYPALTIEALRAELKDEGVAISGVLSAEQAIAGTQTAIWHFSDDKTLDEDNNVNVKALYAFLTGPKNVGMASQPSVSLDVTPKTLAGQAGKAVGPFTVATSADKIAKVTSKLPSGVTITDKDGNVLAASAIKNGTEIFVSVPAATAPGEGSFELEASAPVATGRVFVSKGPEESQSLIVGASEVTELKAGATASWTASAPTTTPAPPVPQASNGGGLANTGVSIVVPIAVGVLLLLSGAGALLFQRRRGRA